LNTHSTGVKLSCKYYEGNGSLNESTWPLGKKVKKKGTSQVRTGAAGKEGEKKHGGVLQRTAGSLWATSHGKT